MSGPHHHPSTSRDYGAEDDNRLIQEALDAGELLRAGEGRYHAKSHVKDNARSEERTVVATSRESDRGVYNNWRPADEVTTLLRQRMRGASTGKTMYVVAYLMAVPGSPLQAFAAEGLDGQLRYDPMSMRPFLSYPEGDYAQHWFTILDQLTHPPIFAHVNWFQRDPQDGHNLWPGYRENLRALLLLLDYQADDAIGQRTPVGVLPTTTELDLTGLDLPPEDLHRILSIDTNRWQEERRHRTEHLDQFLNLPDRILGIHEQVTQALLRIE